MVKQEERRRAFSLLLAPLLRWVVEWGWTRALARTTCLSFSLGISPSVPFPSRAPALLPFLPSLLSVSILLTRLLVVSTPFSRAARWVRVASLSSLPFLSISFPFFLLTCKDGNG
jgi:hypothetical protein